MCVCVLHVSFTEKEIRDNNYDQIIEAIFNIAFSFGFYRTSSVFWKKIGFIT